MKNEIIAAILLMIVSMFSGYGAGTYSAQLFMRGKKFWSILIFGLWITALLLYLRIK